MPQVDRAAKPENRAAAFNPHPHPHPRAATAPPWVGSGAAGRKTSFRCPGQVARGWQGSWAGGGARAAVGRLWKSCRHGRCRRPCAARATPGSSARARPQGASRPPEGAARPGPTALNQAHSPALEAAGGLRRPPCTLRTGRGAPTRRAQESHRTTRDGKKGQVKSFIRNGTDEKTKY